MLRRRSATLSSAQSLDAPTGITWTRCKKCGKYAKEHGGFLRSIPIATSCLSVTGLRLLDTSHVCRGQFMPFVVGWWGSRHRPDADLEPMVSNSDLKKIWQQRPTTAWTHPPSIGSVFLRYTATLPGGGRGSGEDPRWALACRLAATRYLQYFITYYCYTIRKEGGGRGSGEDPRWLATTVAVAPTPRPAGSTKSRANGRLVLGSAERR